MNYDFIQVGDVLINLCDVSMIGRDGSLIYAIFKNQKEKVDLVSCDTEGEARTMLNRIQNQIY